MKRLTKLVVLLATLLILALGYGLLNSWAADRSLKALKLSWAPAPSQFVAVDGMLVHVRDQGRRDDPTPIVLLHGTSASLHTWEAWAAVLQDQHRVISLDLPGFGLTGPFPDGDYRSEHYLRFLADLLDQLQVPKAVLIGNSLGGQLAWQFALEAPQRVSKLVLVDAAGYPRQSSKVPIGFRLAQIPALEPLMTKMLARSMIESSLRSVYGDPNKVTDELVTRYYELTLRRGNRQALIERFKQTDVGDSYKRISEIKVPTLILWGGLDGLIAPINAEHFKRDIKGSRLLIFPELGHVPHEEAPLTTLPAVQQFLAQ